MIAPSRRQCAVWLAVILAAALAMFVSRPAGHLALTKLSDRNDLQALPAGYVDDASRMNAAHVARLWSMPADPAHAEPELARVLQLAAESGLRVAIAGARHTMGGHTIYPDGVAIDMTPLGGMQLHAARGILHVQAGARWADVITYLDARGWSVAVMQSNNSFTVGGSLGCNCHGWQYGKPPIASTVQSFRLMLADGSVVRCDRQENAELFSLVLGGYGLFGVVLEVELRVVPNERYRLQQIIVPAAEALDAFDRAVAGPDQVAMAYARLDVSAEHFLQRAIINVLYREPRLTGALPPLRTPELGDVRRALFRGSAGSDYGKRLRWQAEVELQPRLNHLHFSRNQLLNESVETFRNRSAASTDILHEYFVPRAQLGQFVATAQRIIPRHGVDLLNVTVRYVDTDHDSYLRYATEPMFALVMLFNQPTTAAGDSRTEALTRELIDAALDHGGRYYLPYRLHATRQQFARAYPQGADFFAAKRRYDPGELFQNEFYLKYGQRTGPVSE